jgi:hypothetical protein
MNQINVIKLIENNSITRLSRTYESKLVDKIKETFTNTEQQLFLASFYCFLNYNSKKDFIVEFDSTWKWCGFTRKDNAKTLLIKNFTENIDYKVFLQSKENSKEGGRPVEKIMLTINTFKKFCLKANTKKADEIHDYYIKLEELLQETINEETNELRLQLLNNQEEKLTIEKELKDEKVIRKQLKAKYECFLSRRIDIDNKYEKGECVYLIGFDEMPDKYKIGYTSDLKKRVADFHTEVPFEPIIFYKQYTPNAKLIEQNIHHILRKFRIHNSKEWFQTDDKEIFIHEIKDIIKFFESKDKKYENIIDVKGDIKNIMSEKENQIKDIDGKEVEEEVEEEVEDEEEEIKDEEDEEDKEDEKDAKKCSNCKLNKIKNEFGKNPTRSDGLNHNCKNCDKEKYKKLKEKKKINIEEKKCSKCYIVKNISDFYNRIGSSDGKTSECIVCTKIMYKNRTENRKEYLETEITEKNCNKCKQKLVIDSFSKKTDSVDGYNPVCKFCVSQKLKDKRQIIKETPESKCCNNCKIFLPIEKFWNCKSNSDGKNHRCSDCCKQKRIKN